MSANLCPEGATLTLNIFLISANEVEVKLTVGNLPGISEMLKHIDVDYLVKSYNLDKVDSGWRVMTRAEIADHLSREANDES